MTDTEVLAIWRAVIYHFRDEGQGELHDGCDNDPPAECSLYGAIRDAVPETVEHEAIANFYPDTFREIASQAQGTLAQRADVAPTDAERLAWGTTKVMTPARWSPDVWPRHYDVWASVCVMAVWLGLMTLQIVADKPAVRPMDGSRVHGLAQAKPEHPAQGDTVSRPSSAPQSAAEGSDANELAVRRRFEGQSASGKVVTPAAGLKSDSAADSSKEGRDANAQGIRYSHGPLEPTRDTSALGQVGSGADTSMESW